MKLLLANQANPKAAAIDDVNALHFAAQKGHVEVMRVLINAGARPPLPPAARAGPAGLAPAAAAWLGPACRPRRRPAAAAAAPRRSAAAGVPVNSKTRKGINALHFAAQNGRPPPPTAMCRAACSSQPRRPQLPARRHRLPQAQPLAPDRRPLHAPAHARAGHLEAVDLLLKRSANVQSANGKGQTALQLAKSPEVRARLQQAAAEAAAAAATAAARPPEEKKERAALRKRKPAGREDGGDEEAGAAAGPAPRPAPAAPAAAAAATGAGAESTQREEGSAAAAAAGEEIGPQLPPGKQQAAKKQKVVLSYMEDGEDE